MFIKENFWVGAKGGLIDERHYLCMRESVWLFLFLLLKQTAVNESGEGVVNYGHPMTREYITNETGFLDSRIERWVNRLRRLEYIRTEKRGNDGLVFFVLAAKNKTKSTRNSQMVAASAQPPKPRVAASAQPPIKSAATYDNEYKEVTLVGGSPIPNSLSSYNKDAAAKPAAGVSLSQVAKSKAMPRPPREKSTAELDAEYHRQIAAMREKGYLQ